MSNNTIPNKSNETQFTIYDDISEEFIKEQVAVFYNLNNDKVYFNLKNFCFLILGLSVASLILLEILGFNYEGKNNFSLSKDEIQWYILIYFISYALYLIITIVCKNRIILKIDSNYPKLEVKQYLFNNSFVNKKDKFYLRIIKFVALIITPDYILSYQSKTLLKDNVRLNLNKNTKPSWYELNGTSNADELSNYEWLKVQVERKYLVEWSNWKNIIISVCMFLFVSIVLFLKVDNHYFWLFLSIYIGIRIVSRGIEIVIAFYKDVVRVDAKIFYKNPGQKIKQEKKLELKDSEYIYINGFRFSLLRTQNRLSLAVHTLIEMFILYAAIYLSLSIIIENFWTNEGEIKPSILISILYSLSLGVFNVSFDPEFVSLRAILHVFQVCLSCVLILLSVAQYLNGNTQINKDSFEYKFYKEFKIFEKKGKRANSKPINIIKLGSYKIHIGEGISYKKIKTGNRKREICFEFTNDSSNKKCTLFLISGNSQIPEKLNIHLSSTITLKFIDKDKIFIHKHL